MVSREQMNERADALAVRAREIKEQFVESVDEDVAVSAVGLTMLSVGLALGATMWLRGRRGVAAIGLPAMLAALGLVVAGGGLWHGRGSRISAAEEQVRSQLAALDPIARMQILRDMAQENVPFVKHAHN